MPGRKDLQGSFRHTTVLVRADIYEGALEQGIDISNTCNQALAGMLGIDYRQQRLDDVPLPAPVIIAKDGGSPGSANPPHPGPKKAAQPPVINADDPKAPVTIAKIRKEAPKKAAGVPAEPEPEKSPAKKTAVKPQVARPAPAHQKKPVKKAGKEDLLKKFIATKVIRDDSGETGISKEDLYGIFSRWCREQKNGTVPDIKEVAVALKTRFAFKEKSIAGSPGWAHVRLK